MWEEKTQETDAMQRQLVEERRPAPPGPQGDGTSRKKSSRAEIRVLCVDDHTVLAEGFMARLEMERGFHCVGHLETADNLVGEVRESRPDIVVVDVEMPGPDPFEATEDLKRALPGVKVVFLSAHLREHYLKAAVESGAWGYFYKGDDPADIVAGLRRVARGRFAIGPKVQQECGLPEAPSDDDSESVSTKLDNLTPRELQVLRMLARGLSRQQIAAEMHRSPKTIDCHRVSVMKKLDIHDRVELARFAIREGLVEA